jgi:hypothetical protein
MASVKFMVTPYDYRLLITAQGENKTLTFTDLDKAWAAYKAANALMDTRKPIKEVTA